MNHCCAIDRMLFVSQYSTRPAGKKKNITEKASGMNHISLACIGSGGVGFSQTWNSEDSRHQQRQDEPGVRADRSVIQPIHGALRISTLDSSTQYSAMKKGICTTMGRQPPSGLTFSSR
jgi:hypothetical protein